MNQKDFKMPFFCLLILFFFSLLCKKKPDENYIEPVRVLDNINSCLGKREQDEDA
ncbi:MAG: hypothetical protein ABIK84_03575 [candidate division WOR-3 bacterium]